MDIVAKMSTILERVISRVVPLILGGWYVHEIRFHAKKESDETEVKIFDIDLDHHNASFLRNEIGKSWSALIEQGYGPLK